MVKINNVIKNSLSDKKGIIAGMKLISINSYEINDVLDYQFYCADETLLLLLDHDGKRIEKKIRKNMYDDLGLEFETYLMDEKRRCKNNCIFCFIDQMPKNMRESLYFKDDDNRLSFLQGNYITLTNLTDDDVARIIKMRLNVNVSVHTTNPELRSVMQGNRFAGESLKYLYMIAKGGLQVNCQIVLCPDFNDKEELERTLSDLSKLYPSVKSVAVVPVGLTRFRENLTPLRSFTKDECCDIIKLISTFGDKMKVEHGERVFYPSDEFFVTAESEFPSAEYYEDFLQYENGVGMWTSLKSEFIAAVDENIFSRNITRKTIATGKIAENMMSELVEMAGLSDKIKVFAIRNDFFGEKITVSGLVTGGDIINQLSGKDLGETLLIPKNMLKADEDIFLDDVSVADLEEKLRVKVKAVENDGFLLLEAFCE